MPVGDVDEVSPPHFDAIVIGAGFGGMYALYRLRAAQGVVGMADRHDRSRLEAACAKAITAGDPSYRTIKGILAAGTDRDLPAAIAAGDGGAGAFLHGPASFANVVPMRLASAITSDEPDMPAASGREEGRP